MDNDFSLSPYLTVFHFIFIFLDSRITIIMKAIIWSWNSKSYFLKIRTLWL